MCVSLSVYVYKIIKTEEHLVGVSLCGRWVGGSVGGSVGGPRWFRPGRSVGQARVVRPQARVQVGSVQSHATVGSTSSPRSQVRPGVHGPGSKGTQTHGAKYQTQGAGPRIKRPGPQRQRIRGPALRATGRQHHKRHGNSRPGNRDARLGLQPTTTTHDTTTSAHRHGGPRRKPLPAANGTPTRPTALEHNPPTQYTRRAQK